MVESVPYRRPLETSPVNSDCRRHAGLLRRLGAMLYDGFLLAGVMIVAAIPLPFFQSAADASAWVRFLSALLSWLVLGLGFFWVALDPQNRAWHDRLSKSIVVVLPRRP